MARLVKKQVAPPLLYMLSAQFQPMHAHRSTAHLRVVDLGLMRVVQVLGALHVARHVVGRSCLTLQGKADRERHGTAGCCSQIKEEEKQLVSLLLRLVRMVMGHQQQV
jgi:hypothetical protein